MKSTVTFCALLATAGFIEAYVPSNKLGSKPVKPFLEFQKASAGAFAAFVIASSAVMTNPPPADALTPIFSSSSMVAEKVIREGVYREYEVEVAPQSFDDARSTFKAASETKSKKGTYTALIAILIVGSFIIPMAQYFWYVRDDDTTDKFFAKNVPEPEPKKKKWF